jgi:hypothetical protein
MATIKERKEALLALQDQKFRQIKQIDKQKNQVITELVEINGKLDLLEELEKESLQVSTNDKNVESSEKGEETPLVKTEEKECEKIT